MPSIQQECTPSLTVGQPGWERALTAKIAALASSNLGGTFAGNASSSMPYGITGRPQSGCNGCVAVPSSHRGMLPDDHLLDGGGPDSTNLVHLLSGARAPGDCVVPKEVLDAAAAVDANLDIDFASEIILLDTKPLGKGVSGSVFRGLYRGTEVAVKMLPASLLVDSSHGELHTFVQEAVVLASIQHINIVPFLGGSLHPPHVFIVEALMEQTLGERLHQNPAPLPLWEMLAISLDVARALEYLHSRVPAIVHRDLKPDNILLDKDGLAKISDFGLARFKYHSYINTKAPDAGTLAYMAPECYGATDANLTDKCDIYSFAVIMWEMVVRRKPWEGMRITDFYREVVRKGTRLEIPQDDNVCPMALRNLISACWSDSPDDRPSCAHIVSEVTRMLKYCPRYT